MSTLLITLLLAQIGASTHTTPVVQFDRPIISVTGKGIATSSAVATDYRLVLFSGVYAEQESEARESADLIKREILKTIQDLGASEGNVMFTNVNVHEPIESDPYYRIEQDIEVALDNIQNIHRIRQAFQTLEGVEIGSLTPVISGMSSYGPAIENARRDAIKNAKEEAQALAREMNVVLGEPIYVAEEIQYPTFTGFEAPVETEVVVLVTIFFEMIYKK